MKPSSATESPSCTSSATASLRLDDASHGVCAEAEQAARHAARTCPLAQLTSNSARRRSGVCATIAASSRAPGPRSDRLDQLAVDRRRSPARRTRRSRASLEHRLEAVGQRQVDAAKRRVAVERASRRCSSQLHAEVGGGILDDGAPCARAIARSSAMSAALCAARRVAADRAARARRARAGSRGRSCSAVGKPRTVCIMGEATPSDRGARDEDAAAGTRDAPRRRRASRAAAPPR